ncbi:hypothetical protein AAG906_013931 [Vitis piasezkii]
MAPKKTVSSARVSEAGEKATDKLDVKEFRERFCIPNGVSIDLVNEEAAMPTEKGLELRGHLVDWVEKASFACVCKLFEIDPKERACKTLLSARNLMAVVRESQEYVVNILPRKLSREEVEPTPPKEFPPPQITYEGDVIIEEPVNAAPHSVSSGPGRIPGLNHSEAASINRPSNLNPDADAAEATPTEEAGAESQSQPSDDPDRLAIIPVKGPSPKKPRLTRNLRSGLLGRLQERQQEIEVSCASAHDAHPDGGEVEMATETSAAPAIIPAEDASGKTRPVEDVEVPNPGQESPSVSSSEEEPVNDAAPASPFSYAELEDKLKQITPDWNAIKPSAKMFDMMETIYNLFGLRSLAQQHNLFTHLLQTADYMKTFSSRRQEIENQLRLRMEKAEASLSTMREENETLRVKLAEVTSREESTRLHEAEGEAARLRDEVGQLRTEASNEKKEGRLAAALDAQKEELEREFAVEREELAAEYQQQKNGIKRDTPSIPPGEEKKLHEKPAPNSSFALFVSNLPFVLLWSGDLFVHTFIHIK